jgi:hypothetical protein
MVLVSLQHIMSQACDGNPLTAMTSKLVRPAGPQPGRMLLVAWAPQRSLASRECNLRGPRTSGTFCHLRHRLTHACSWRALCGLFDVFCWCALHACVLDPFPLLQGCPRYRRAAVCSVIVPFVFLVGACVVGDINRVPAGARVLAPGLVHRFLSALALLPASGVAGRCALSVRPAQGAEAEASLGYGVVPEFLLFSWTDAFCLVMG